MHSYNRQRLTLFEQALHNGNPKSHRIEFQGLFASRNLCWQYRGAFDSAKNHKRQRRKRQSVTAKREKSQTPKFV